MNTEDLKKYLSNEYQGSQSFLETIIYPIFGEEEFIDGYETEILDNHPEYRKMADATGIRSVKDVGMIYIDGEPLQIFDISVSDRIMMERNRVTIQSLVHRIMDQYSNAFMIFHYEDETRWDWRFTFCHKSANKEESTDSKRYTFLLGPNQSCRTAADNFLKLYEKRENLMLDDIENAFSVEALSDRFFNEYKEIYADIIFYITGKRMVKVGNKWEERKEGRACRKILDEFSEFDDPEKAVRDYVKKLMGRLVFLQFLQKKGWLGVPFDKEWGEGDKEFLQNLFARTEDKDNFVDNVLEKIFNDLNTEREGDKSKKYRFKIPYLNGGLFERDETDKTNFPLPAKYMQDMLDFFSYYNFTIDENDPDDAEVGVDPEMLGRIFENLLEDNKDKGAFYTPKEIVNYMCRESLIAYLQTGIEDETTKEALRQFVTTHNVEKLGTNKKFHLQVDEALKTVKVCDPAIGSGAFPMGLLKELFLCRTALEGIEQSRAAEIKKHIIQHNIYGVDIERGAVDIARLRFWLSLIVDEETPQALPNLDFKIMQGNSLLEQYKGVDLSTVVEKKRDGMVDMFDDMVDVLRLDLRKLLTQYYECTDHKEKKALRKKITDNVKQQLLEQGITVSFGDLDLAGNDQFFLWHTWFYDVFSQGGFDIVIGNPPYISIQGMPTTMRKLYKNNFKFFFHRYDIFGCFIELGLKVLSESCILTFIQPSVFLNSKSFALCRKYLVVSCSIFRLDILQDGIFDAVVPTMIMFVRNKPSDNQIISCSNGINQERHDISQNRFVTTDANVFNVNLDECAAEFIEKTQSECVLLGDIARVSNGINTGNLSSYLYDKPARNRIPVIKGGSISKWIYNYHGMYLDKAFDEYVSCGDIETLSSQKLMMKRIGIYPNVCYDDSGMACLHTIHTIRITDSRFLPKFIMAILNSKLIGYIFRLRVPLKGNVFPEFRVFDLNKQIPIKITSRDTQKTIVKLVDQILSNNSGDIEPIENQINQMIYHLYGLTYDEVLIVDPETPITREEYEKD